jgi:hypothetical protein
LRVPRRGPFSSAFVITKGKIPGAERLTNLVARVAVGADGHCGVARRIAGGGTDAVVVAAVVAVRLAVLEVRRSRTRKLQGFDFTSKTPAWGSSR